MNNQKWLRVDGVYINFGNVADIQITEDIILFSYISGVKRSFTKKYSGEKKFAKIQQAIKLFFEYIDK